MIFGTLSDPISISSLFIIKITFNVDNLVMRFNIIKNIN